MTGLRGCSVRRGDAAIGPLDVELPAGQYHVLLGPSGAGKTTVLGLLAGVVEPDDGIVTGDGESLGYLLQDHPLFPHLDVEGNVAFGLRSQGVARAEAHARAAEALRLVALEGLAARMPATLSGGERRRVALAQVLAPRLSVLLLDEPTLNLDPPTRTALLHDLKRIQRELGLTVLHVTHDFEEAFAQADLVSVMRAGRIVQSGTADEVFRAPRDEALARFVGVENIWEGRVVRAGDAFVFETGRNRFVLAESGEGTRVILRAEDVLLAREEPRTSARNVLRCRVVSLEVRGATVRVGLDANGDAVKAIVTRGALGELRLGLGDDVHAAFKASALRLL